MKYIILSFDDGRKDSYEIVIPLLKKYGITASFHIVTGFSDETWKEPFETMSVDNVKEIAQAGFDISSHGDRHINEESDLQTSLQKLQLWGVDKSPRIFSSPHSDIYEGNIKQYISMLRNNRIEYVRSGIQIRRNGFVYLVLYILQICTKSNWLYYFLNKSNIMKKKNMVSCEGVNIIKSVSVKQQNTVEQLQYLVNRLQPDDVVCFMFHSIRPKKDMGEDNYAFCSENFEMFLNRLKYDEQIKILNLFEYVNL